MACRARRSPMRTSQRSRALTGASTREAPVEHAAQGAHVALGAVRLAPVDCELAAQRVERVRVEREGAPREHERVEPVVDVRRDPRAPRARPRGTGRPRPPRGRRGWPRRGPRPRLGATSSKRGAPASAAASSPCTCAAPPTRSPGFDQRATRTPAARPPTTRSMHTSTTRSRARRARSSPGRRRRAAPPRSADPTAVRRAARARGESYLQDTRARTTTE